MYKGYNFKELNEILKNRPLNENMTHESKGLFSKHNVKSVYMNYRELFDESTMFEDIFIERLQPGKHYSILAKVCYTTEEQELFLTLGDKVGVYLEEGLSEKEHK